MAKRSALSFDRDQLTQHLKASTGQGIGALFSPPPKSPRDDKLPQQDSQNRPRQPKPPVSQAEKRPAGGVAQSPAKSSSSSTKTDTVTQRSHATAIPRNREAMAPRHRGLVPPGMVRRIRGAVKNLGKEAATHRFTQEEKDKIADIVYTYHRQGYKTSENEIARIGINWLIDEYQENGGQSILHRVLKALRE